MSGKRYQPLTSDERREKKRQSVLKRIDKLRAEHTRLFNTQDTDLNCWQKMDTITRKLIEAWDAYHRLG